MKRMIVALIMLVLLIIPSPVRCGGIPVYDGINYLQALLLYLKEIEECMAIVNTEWATLEEFRRNVEKIRRQINEYERMFKAGEKVIDLIEEEKWKDAAKRARRLYDWGLDEFFDKRPGTPVDIEDLIGEYFYIPRTSDEVITDAEEVDIESEKINREIRLNREELEILKRRLLYAAGTQSESDRRRKEVFPKARDMLNVAEGESAEALLKALAEQNMILMQQLQDLIDYETQAAINAGNDRVRRASESAEFIDHEVERLNNRQPRQFKWGKDRISGDL